MHREISLDSFSENTFKIIGEDSMLITAKKPDGSFNTMTASWGGLGVMWAKKIAMCVIRPHRYTYEFAEAAETLTFSFFPGDYKAALTLCGTKSGRDCDKIALAGLTPVQDGDAAYFSEARLVLVCRKLYHQDIDPAGLEDAVREEALAFYPNNDFHRMYVGEIVKALGGSSCRNV